MRLAGWFFLSVSLVFCASSRAEDGGKNFFAALQEKLKPSEVVTYKTIGSRELTLHVFHPDGFKPTDKRPAQVVIHGGGWRSGTPRRFYPYAQNLLSEGYVGISVEYRLIDKKKGITVFDCVKDGRAAIRYIRSNAKKLGVDPARIAVAGGSAGAHVALGTALFNSLDHADEDLSVSCKPDALILLFAVLDTSEKGYGNALIGSDWKKISPLHQIGPGMPPTLVFHGDKDNVAPYPILIKFCETLKEQGNTYELILEKGGVHGHINNNKKLFLDAAKRTESFLSKHMSGSTGK
jgi:acetyl esterase